MQCANRGWACFDGWNNSNGWLNHTPFGQGNAFFDPIVLDITGRTLECFGFLLARNDASYCKTGKKLMMDGLRIRIRHACHTAIQYLRLEQDCYGRWGSRWHVNYLNGTSSVLCGLEFFPEDIHDSRGQSLEEKMVQRPLAWIKAVQNQDGGWGHSVSSYREGSESERAECTPTQTAWAIMGLIAHFSPTDIVIVKGIQYLVRTQTAGSYVSDEDGIGIGAGPGATWRQRAYVSVGFPDILWLDYSSSHHG
jgi:squalene-hopene/tetraprenyl-beta-curcumene cyclase